MNQPLNFVFVSRSGAGKGTQVKFLRDKFPGLVSISTGDLMRDLATQDTQVGRRIKETLDHGGLPFDDIATTLWMHAISYKLRSDEGLICDGFPRRLSEAENLDHFLRWLNRYDRTIVIYIDLSRDLAFERLKMRGREDDNDEDINNRLDYFEERVLPVIEHYRVQGKLHSVDGEPSREEVFQQILQVIDEFNKNTTTN